MVIRSKGTPAYTLEITVGDAELTVEDGCYVFFFLCMSSVEFGTIVKLQEVFLKSKNKSPAFLMEFKTYQDVVMTKNESDN
jgi:hypothetical protein